nr:3-phosphoshikimate 1-carboxyvinyltransferase [Actinomycetota bacterium]
PVASAQVKTALLLAGCVAHGTTSVIEPARSRDHTERMLAAAGIPVTVAPDGISLAGPASPQPLALGIPGDFSSAAFLIVAALLVEGSDLVVDNVGLNPTRTGLLEVLREMGADVESSVDRSEGGEPVGTIRARFSTLSAVSPSRDKVATFIDEIPILAVAATQAEGRTEIRGAAELRVKESDRVAAVVEGLASLGADVQAHPDGISVTGPTPLAGGEVDCFGDHRIAMAFAVTGLIADDNVRIAGWGSVATSFPEFLDVLGRAQGRIAP